MNHLINVSRANAQSINHTISFDAWDIDIFLIRTTEEEFFISTVFNVQSQKLLGYAISAINEISVVQNALVEAKAYSKTTRSIILVHEQSSTFMSNQFTSWCIKCNFVSKLGLFRSGMKRVSEQKIGHLCCQVYKTKREFELAINKLY